MDASIFAIASSSRLNDLEHSWSVLDVWLNRWTALVVIGVVTEIIFVVWDFAEELHDFRRGTIRSPARPSTLKLLLELAAVACVAIGVAGEFTAHIRAGKLEGEMRDISRQQISVADDHAGDANKKAAEARLETAKLLAFIQPREFTPEWKSFFKRSVEPFIGKNVHLSFTSYVGDTEAARLALEIDSFRQSIGLVKTQGPSDWDIGGVGAPKGTGFRFGIKVYDVQSHAIPGLAKAIARGLHAELLPVTGSLGFPTPDAVVIFIGLKPLPK